MDLVGGLKEKVGKIDMNATVQRMKEGAQNRGKTFWIILASLIILIIVVLSVLLRRSQKYKKLYYNTSGSLHTFKNDAVSITGQVPIHYSRLSAPTEGKSFCYSTWLYVQNWYHNYDKWKHVYHRGTQIQNGCDISWNTVPLQYPGIWLGKITNDLRVVMKTIVLVPKTCLGNIEEEEEEEKTTTTTISSSLKQCIARGQSVQLVPFELLEYADIPNIPVGDWFHLFVSVQNKKIEIYMNGKLWLTKVLVGSPDIDRTKENGYFGVSNTYSGRICNFRYIPKYVPYPAIQKLYNLEKKKKPFNFEE
jgi:hypothetical protein